MNIVKWYEDPVYIKQCEKAEELYLFRESRAGDFIYNLDTNQVGVLPSDFAINSVPVWRQDQLQGMVGITKVEDIELQEIAEGLDGKPGWLQIASYSQNETDKMTLEQFWLCYVMKDKFNKVWNGSEWVKE